MQRANTMMRAAASRVLPAARSRAHDSAAAVAASRRLALAVFVVVLAPAEASEVFLPITSGLQKAVKDWVADAAVAEKAYGAIAEWDVSSVDDMSKLFAGKTTFNAQIGGWDTSGVTSMYYTFDEASSFNSELSASEEMSTTAGQPHAAV